MLYITTNNKNRRNKREKDIIWGRKKWLHSELQVTFPKAELWEFGPPSANINGLKCSSGCNKRNNTREESQDGRAGTPVLGTMGIWLPEIMGLNRAQHHCYCSWENGALQARLHPGRLKTREKKGKKREKKWNIQYRLHLTVWSEMSKIMEGEKACLMFVLSKWW